MATDTKTALLDVAEHAARARGFDGFSYADLAEAVGIRKASVHYHFASKALLSAALMERYQAKVEARCDAISRANPLGAARLSAIIDFYREALHDGKTLCLCVALTGSRESLSPGVAAQIAGFRRTMIGWLASVFALGRADGTIAGVTDPEDEARAALATLEGGHLAARAEEDPAVFDRAVRTLLARCVH